MVNDTLERWTTEKSADLYGIHNWGARIFQHIRERRGGVDSTRPRTAEP